MYNTNRFGQNKPMCNNRQYGTWEFVKQPEDMKLKPEYLGNENFKFVNNFGLPQQFNTEKKFIEINNCYNLNQSNNRMALKPSHTTYSVPNLVSTAVHTNFNHNYNTRDNRERPHITENITKIKETNLAETMTNKQVKPVQEFNKDMPINNQDLKNPSTNSKHPKKNKRHNKAACDKTNQKSCKKSKKQKNFQKQSKKETDRNIINCMSPRKHKNNKSRNKKYSKIDIMDIDDIQSNPEQNMESPISCLPNTQMYICTLSSPIKISMKINNAINSNCSFSEPKQSEAQTDHSTMLNNFRSRLPSECESEDSFIVFEGSSGNCDIDDDDDYEDSVDSDATSDEESDESDVTDFYTASNQYQGSMSSVDECDGSQVMDFSISLNCRSKTSSPSKKVRFADEKDLCEIHPMIKWSFAYQKARKGPWEQFAVDRARFKNRISNVEPILNGVLQPLHRNRIFKERFQDVD